MTKDDIAKLPTPETGALVRSNPNNCGLHEMAEAFNRMLDHARSLERQRDAALMALDWALTGGGASHRGQYEWNLLDKANETLAAIRGDK